MKASKFLNGIQKLEDKTLNVSRPIGEDRKIDGKLIKGRVRAVSMRLGLSSDETMQKRVETKEGIEIDLSPKSTKEVHKIELDSDGHFKLRNANSFLDDNVD